jgi:mono/diheme cytochrome c family protein
MNTMKVPDAAPTLKAAMDGNKARGVQFVADRILNPPANAGRGGGAGAAVFTPEQQNALERGGAIYAELCFTCHGEDGRGAPAPGSTTGLTVAPSLVGSSRVSGHRDYVINAVLHGLTGPIDGKTYSQVMVPMGSNKDQWVADVASYVRASFGNSGSFVTPADVAKARAGSGDRKTQWTVDELMASIPRALVPDASWKVTASHDGRPTPGSNAAGAFNMISNAAGALNFLGWTTGVPQQPGMWFQVELPAPTRLTEIQFTASTIGGGRNGPPAMATFPRRSRVQVSSDGTTWTAPVAEGEGTAGVTTVQFPPVIAKFIRMTQTATVTEAVPWSMRLLRLYEAPAASTLR